MGILRLLLALTVVVGHNLYAFQWVGPGVLMAVKAFFIISGFYMALILSGKYASIPAFYVSRFLRLYPIYFFVLVLSYVGALLAGGVLGPVIDLNIWSQIGKPLALLLKFANISMIGIDLTTFGCVDNGSFYFWDNGCPGKFLNRFILVPQAWSVSIEIAFYAIAPFVVRLSNRHLASLIVACLAIRFAIDFSQLNVNPWHRSVLPLELVYFFLGVAAFRFYQSGRLTNPILAISLIAATPFYYLVENAVGVDRLKENFCWWLYFALLTLALPSLFRLTKNSKLDRNIGELSYPVYISHILIMGTIDTLFGVQGFDTLGKGGWLILNVTSVMLFSWLCIKVIGEPFDRLRHALALRPVSATVL